MAKSIRRNNAADFVIRQLDKDVKLRYRPLAKELAYLSEKDMYDEPVHATIYRIKDMYREPTIDNLSKVLVINTVKDLMQLTGGKPFSRRLLNSLYIEY